MGKKEEIFFYKIDCILNSTDAEEFDSEELDALQKLVFGFEDLSNSMKDFEWSSKLPLVDVIISKIGSNAGKLLNDLVIFRKMIEQKETTEKCCDGYGKIADDFFKLRIYVDQRDRLLNENEKKQDC